MVVICYHKPLLSIKVKFIINLDNINLDNFIECLNKCSFTDLVGSGHSYHLQSKSDGMMLCLDYLTETKKVYTQG